MLLFGSEIRKYVPVKIYGKCGEECPSTFKNANFKAIFGSEFKFYLSFENAFCKDYITETFFIMLRYNIIPIVMGSGKYEDYILKFGYIDSLEFAAVKDLTDYLLYLDKNRTAYNSYFQWKRWVYSKYTGMYAAEICEFCVKVHLDSSMGET